MLQPNPNLEVVNIDYLRTVAMWAEWMVAHMDLVFDMPLGMLMVEPEYNRDVDTVEQLPV